MKKPTLKLSVADDFSREPIGRYITDGPTSGQVFRERTLVPALDAADKVIVVLDGTEGYGSSFLEEGFAGVLRQLNIGAAEFKQRVSIVSNDDPSLITEIIGYVDEEDQRRKAVR